MSEESEKIARRRTYWIALIVAAAVLIAAAVATVWWLAPRSAPEPAASLLRVDGQVVRGGGGEGDIVDLRGTNLGGWLLQEGWMSPAGEALLEREGWTAAAGASREGNEPALALDGDAATSWWSGQPVAAGDRFSVDMGASTTFDRIDVDAAVEGDVPGSFTVQASNDAVTWWDVATAQGAVASIVATTGSAQTARYLAVVATAPSASWWSIGEVRAYVSDDFHTRDTLVRRFGDEEAQRLLAAYQDAWIQGSDLDAIASLGLNTLRVPLSWQQLLRDDGSERPDAEAFGRLDWLIAESARRGMYVVIDFHGTPGGNCPWQSCGVAGSNRLWTDPTFQEWTEQAWKRIAARYRDEPAVAAYDLLNEPLTTSGAEESEAQLTQKFDFYDRLYDAVRGVDEDHIVMIAAFPSFDSAPPPSEYGWSNVVYQTHHYDFGSSGDPQAMSAFVERELEFLTEYRARWGVPVYAGEFWFGNDPDPYRRWFAGLAEIHGSWTNWTFKHRAGQGPASETGAGTGDKWSLFYGSTAEVPDINLDSFETLREKWARFTTASFTPDRSLMAIYRSAAGAETASSVPGFVEAEHFAASTGVLLEQSADHGAGWNTTSLQPGDQLSFDLTAEAAGSYEITARVDPSAGEPSRLSLETDGATAHLEVPAGDEQGWTNATVTIDLPAGRSRLTVRAESGEGKLNWLHVAAP